ncbi:hypothetical protein AYO43_05280 [Nitrospira sp. SCGC AG-212-E16]|nr:hypothetical protein AYO43_05280 [Nitrospira sp. SCGC AG-212-E16]
MIAELRSVPAFHPGRASVGPRSFGKVTDGRQGSIRSSNDLIFFLRCLCHAKGQAASTQSQTFALPAGSMHLRFTIRRHAADEVFGIESMVFGSRHNMKAGEN